jgi:hypothetical protein
MSKPNVSYLFGNLKKDGNADIVDKDFQSLVLACEENSEYLNNILSMDLNLKPAQAGTDDSQVLPDHNAVDYAEEDELADDLLPQKPIQTSNTFIPLQTVFHSFPAVPAPAKLNLSLLFPSFVPGGRLKFSELFASKSVKQYQFLRLDKIKPSFFLLMLVSSDLYYELSVDDIEKFMTPQSSRFRTPTPLISPIESNLEIEQVAIHSENSASKSPISQSFLEPASLDPVVLESWENDIIYEQDEDMGVTPSISTTFERSTMFRNIYLEDDKWLNCVIWDEDDGPIDEMDFHMDDPKLVILENEVEEIYSKI